VPWWKMQPGLRLPVPPGDAHCAEVHGLVMLSVTAVRAVTHPMLYDGLQV